MANDDDFNSGTPRSTNLPNRDPGFPIQPNPGLPARFQEVGPAGNVPLTGRVEDFGNGPEPTMREVMAALGKMKRENDELKVQIGTTASKRANTVDYYACNVCGDRTEGERCPKHPTEKINGIGLTVNQAGETRQAILSKA